MKRELLIATLLAVVTGVTTYAAADRRSTLAQSGDVPVGSHQPGVAEPNEVQVLYSRLARITGPNRLECGDFIRRSGQAPPATTTQLERAVACAEAAAAGKSAFWLATGGFVVESWQIEGLVGAPDGELKHFVYDSFGPSLRLTPCGQPVVGLPLATTTQIVCGSNKSAG